MNVIEKIVTTPKDGEEKERLEVSSLNERETKDL